jgi:hypothetical protein
VTLVSESHSAILEYITVYRRMGSGRDDLVTLHVYCFLLRVAH